jgi:quercetin dioxygenase-like cupin family protein
MKKVICIITFALTAALFNQTKAQDSTLFPKGEIGKNTDNYTGTIWLSELNQPDSNFNFSLAQATYAPGSKLNWHVHPAGQYLLITQGTGYYQEKGKPAQLVHKGDIIKCLPGVAHWHGAAPASSFAYVAVTPTTKGKTIWLQRVTDEEYKSVK